MSKLFVQLPLSFENQPSEVGDAENVPKFNGENGRFGTNIQKILEIEQVFVPSQYLVGAGNHICRYRGHSLKRRSRELVAYSPGFRTYLPLFLG